MYFSSHGGNTQQSTNCAATDLPLRKLSNFDEPDMQGIAGEAGTSSLVRYSNGHPQTEQKQDDQLEPTYSSSVRIRDDFSRTKNSLGLNSIYFCWGNNSFLA